VIDCGSELRIDELKRHALDLSEALEIASRQKKRPQDGSPEAVLCVWLLTRLGIETAQGV